MSCDWTDPLSCVGSAATGAVAATVPAAWDAICKSFVDAASSVLAAFGSAFTAMPNLNPADSGISKPYAVALAIGAVVAVLLVFGQIARVAWTHDGRGLAQALTGGAKTIAAWMLTASVVTASLAAANQVSKWSVQETFGSQAAFSVRLGQIVDWSEVAGKPGQVAIGASMLLVIALVGIVLTVVLWFELLLRNAALGVLIAMSPIAAAGQLSETTKVWWQRTVSASVQLIILKPVIALVFYVGFSFAGNAHGIEAVLEGLLVLVLAVFSWPVIARFFTFATIQSSSSGLAAALGFVAGRMASGDGGGQPAGVTPRDWSLGAEQHTMANRGGLADGGAADGGVPETAAAQGGAEVGIGGGSAAGGAAGGGVGGGTGPRGGGGTGGSVLAGIGWALQTAHRAGTMLAGRMEQTAGNAGMQGAYPYSTLGGGNGRRIAPPRYGQAPRADGGSPPDAVDETAAEQPPMAEPPNARAAYEPPDTYESDDLTPQATRNDLAGTAPDIPEMPGTGTTGDMTDEEDQS